MKAKTLSIRPTQRADLPGVAQILTETELFPPEILPEMYAASQQAEPDEIWLTAELAGEVVGFCYAKPEALTEGTWNMLAIGILTARQGGGIGGRLTTALEDILRASGNRILIADTSGTDEFAQTRAFYCKQGYAEEARIRDFWAAGDDKVTFRKAL